MRIKLAVRKENGSIPGGGSHYMLHPIAMKNESEASLFGLIGYTIIEVSQENADRLLKNAFEAINHQLEVAYFTEKRLQEIENG